jgi:hypothetical protein
MSDFVSSQLAKIAAAREAKLAAQACPGPAAEPEPPSPAAIVPAGAGAGTAGAVAAGPVKPADCRQEDWDAMPPDVRALVASGPGAQAVQVNPPEAAAGLVASATENVEDAPKRGRGRPKGYTATAEAAPVAAPVAAPAPVDFAPVVAELERIRDALESQPSAKLLLGIQKALDAQAAATKELTEAVLGAAQILAG